MKPLGVEMSTETIAPKVPETQAERLGEPWTDAALRGELQKGLDDIAAGRVYTAEEVDRLLQEKFGI